MNLRDGGIEVHRQPAATRYAEVTRRGRGDRLTLVAFADVEVVVSDILPPAVSAK